MSKKQQNGIIKKILAVMTAIFIILVGVFCTSPSKAAVRPVQIPETETDPPTETDAPETTERIVYETIGEDVSLPETSFFDSTYTDVTSETVTETETETETEEVTTVGELSELTFRFYTGRDLGPNEKIYDSCETDTCSIIITKVSSGNLNYYICDVQINSPKDFHTAFAGGAITGRAYTSKTASQVGAVLAVNGDFCGFITSGIIIREGVLYRNKSSKWDLCYLDKNGDLITTSQSKVDANKLIEDGVIQSWSFGPSLLDKNGKALTKDEVVTPGLSRSAREPRTAIGQVGPLHYIVLVVDAVRTSTETVGGMSFAELAKTFEGLGCKTAYNLDGGGSTTLYYKGEVINSPCVNGERNVSDIIYFK